MTDHENPRRVVRFEHRDKVGPTTPTSEFNGDRGARKLPATMARIEMERLERNPDA